MGLRYIVIVDQARALARQDVECGMEKNISRHTSEADTAKFVNS